MVGRASICAEAVALGNAILANDHDLVVLASVRHPKPTETSGPRLVPPCGLCRELLIDYCPDLTVVFSDGDQIESRPLRTFLPYKYQGTKWAHETSGRQ
jgi:cytidine deaminase